MPTMKKKKLRDPMLEALRDPHTSRSISEAYQHQQDIQKAPLSDRQEAREAFYEAMATDPALVAERVGWLIDGNYGQGEMLKAKQVIASPRMNRRAALTHLVGMFEWQCPTDFAAKAWHKLTASEKKALDAALDVVIEAAEAEMAAEQGE